MISNNTLGTMLRIIIAINIIFLWIIINVLVYPFFFLLLINIFIYTTNSIQSRTKFYYTSLLLYILVKNYIISAVNVINFFSIQIMAAKWLTASFVAFISIISIIILFFLYEIYKTKYFQAKEKKGGTIYTFLGNIWFYLVSYFILVFFCSNALLILMIFAV